MYDHVKKINFVACGLFLRGKSSSRAMPHRLAVHGYVPSWEGGEQTSGLVRGASRRFPAFSVSEKKLQTPAPVLGGRVALRVSLC